ncbi:hypothetical protein CFOL_v3_08882 [Cephalotus follicularis]|uniref:C2H2-type domain-containing protein n=1 Tax=Cephalotus follicularis TaxID=3775 RepID=A0A1Q3BBE4_CEPFO|nr:hypothetical protein CFOL_v3_08882 [Cephalotus follicularis]
MKQTTLHHQLHQSYKNKMGTLSTMPSPDLLVLTIDMTTLTQSELHSLSLLSSSSFDLRRTDDLVIPTIDRSLFNESSGSRRQTYSRPSPTHHHHHRHRIAGLLPSSSSSHHHPPPSTANTNTEHLDRLENYSIINSLKQLISQNPNFTDIEFFPPPPFQPSFQQQQPLFAADIVRKRKRGRKPKMKPGFEGEKGLDIVNRNGVAVDLAGLANLEDPYRDEISRRTEGMGSEEELLGFLTDLGGQWCSRRRKRKIVDACIIGDALPVEWKLLLGLRRREGRASLYVRRYISPGGKQFISCKEVSAYLQSYFGLLNTSMSIDNGGGDIQLDYAVASESHSGFMLKEEVQWQSNEIGKEDALLGDNLEDVQIRDLFECHKCNMTFDEKDTYLQHLLSFHQRTTRRYRLGSSVGDGVIIKDGKYECQFCHKVFHERRRYNGHVGIHVRNYVRGIEESPGRLTLEKGIMSPSREGLPARISKMDALIEIAQNSIMETSSAGPNDEMNGVLTAVELNVVSQAEIPASSDHEFISESSLSETEMEDGLIGRKLNNELYRQNSEFMITDEKIDSIDDTNGILDVRMDFRLDTTTALPANGENANTSDTFYAKDGVAFTGDKTDKSSMERGRFLENHSLLPLSNHKICGNERTLNMGCTNTPECCKPDELSNEENVEVVKGFGSNNLELGKDNLMVAAKQTSKEDALKGGESESSIFPTFNEIHTKGEVVFCSMDGGHDNVTGFGELRLDEIEHLKFSFGDAQESLSLSEVPLDLENNAEMQRAYGSSIQTESGVMLNETDGHQLTMVTVCVWCGIEFSHDAVDSEIQSDSVGYMCPACKAKYLANSMH